ncbi:MAG: NAD(P)/FAD-dependent oxidoreductase [Acidimicrobiales bacterium]
MSEQTNVDVVVVGAGFAGLYMIHRMVRTGRSVLCFEGGTDVGGTWYWNRYPGCRCDVESLEYSYDFDPDLQQEWSWTEKYATQPEILRYAQHVADRFDLRRHIRFSTRVSSAHFEEATGRWTVRADDGTTTSARFVVMATGCLSSANMPEIEGRDSFQGTSPIPVGTPRRASTSPASGWGSSAPAPRASRPSRSSLARPAT